jgi:8-oxo-dGTP diphosphatase
VSPAQIELIVRAVITRGSRLLLAQPTGRTWYFLPGGHVEPGESAAEALRRELEEELGVSEVQVGSVLAVAENRYADEQGEHHELNLVHRVTISEAIGGSREAHLAFRWLELAELGTVEVRPSAMAELLQLGLDGPQLEVQSDGFV